MTCPESIVDDRDRDEFWRNLWIGVPRRPVGKDRPMWSIPRGKK